MSALNDKCWIYASSFLFFCQGLWKNSKAELWWRQHSLGGEKTVQIWDEVRWCCQVSPNYRSTRHCYLSGLRLLCTKQHAVVILPSPQVDQCLGRACAFDLMAEYGGRFVGAGCLISTLGSSHSFCRHFQSCRKFCCNVLFLCRGVLCTHAHRPLPFHKFVLAPYFLCPQRDPADGDRGGVVWKQQLWVQPHGGGARRPFWNLVVQEVGGGWFSPTDRIGKPLQLPHCLILKIDVKKGHNNGPLNYTWKV